MCRPDAAKGNPINHERFRLAAPNPPKETGIPETVPGKWNRPRALTFRLAKRPVTPFVVIYVRHHPERTNGLRLASRTHRRTSTDAPAPISFRFYLGPTPSLWRYKHRGTTPGTGHHSGSQRPSRFSHTLLFLDRVARAFYRPSVWPYVRDPSRHSFAILENGISEARKSKLPLTPRPTRFAVTACLSARGDILASPSKKLTGKPF